MMSDPDPPREAGSRYVMLKSGLPHLEILTVYLKNGASGGYSEHSN